MSNTYVKRATFFKVPKEEDIQSVLKQYEVLRKNAVKVWIVYNSLKRPLTSRLARMGSHISSQTLHEKSSILHRI